LGRAGGQFLIDARHVFLRLGEDHGDRLQLRDRNDAGLLPGVDEIALIDGAKPRATRDRRPGTPRTRCFPATSGSGELFLGNAAGILL
jgi:hypothetical protein